MRKTVALLAVMVMLCGAVPAFTDSFSDVLRRAQNGDAQSQFRVGAMYALGEGVRLDYSEAAEWLYKAAVQGHSSAQTLLGMFYEYGKGVDQDYYEALTWYQRAAENGNEFAQSRWNDLTNRLIDSLQQNSGQDDVQDSRHDSGSSRPYVPGYNRRSTCPKCLGDKTLECRYCQGKGGREQLSNTFNRYDTTKKRKSFWVRCTTCGGSGRVKCPVCGGEGTLP